jgi:hypothetical protein
MNTREQGHSLTFADSPSQQRKRASTRSEHQPPLRLGQELDVQDRDDSAQFLKGPSPDCVIADLAEIEGLLDAF